MDEALLIDMGPLWPIHGLKLGYWLWLASIGSALVAALLSNHFVRLPPPWRP
jgi:hypothetical protein